MTRTAATGGPQGRDVLGRAYDRVWKWLAIMQGYDLDIQHIPDKVNPADHLSQQLLKDAAERKGLVIEENQKFVEQLRIPHDATDVEIQDALCKIFER